MNAQQLTKEKLDLIIANQERILNSLSEIMGIEDHGFVKVISPPLINGDDDALNQELKQVIEISDTIHKELIEVKNSL